jgi:NAD(P)-dependent dehydrogenase (short-subunit alcohol dehydrogenase family)
MTEAASQREASMTRDSSEMRLQSKRVCLTVGASRTGRIICKLFAQEGASIAIGDVDITADCETLETANACGAQGIFVRADVPVDSDVQELVDAVASSLGGIAYCLSLQSADLDSASNPGAVSYILTEKHENGMAS